MPDPQRVLDVGSGTGNLTRAVAERWPDCDVIGVDPSVALPLDDASVDAALALLVLTVVPDADRPVAQMRRVTRPGCLLPAAVWDYRAPTAWWVRGPCPDSPSPWRPRGRTLGEEAFTMATTTGSTSSTDDAPAGQGPRSSSPLGRAWISIALVPVFFFLSFLAQTGIYVMTGHDPSTGDVPPLWANLAAGIPGLAILLVPCVAGVVYGLRAARAGVRAGLVPAVLATLLGVGAVVMTVLNL